jgi:hypothetical protein
MRLTVKEQEQRVAWSVRSWEHMVFVTATLVEEEHDPRVISSRWTDFIKELKRSHYPDLRSVRVLQEHEKGHGWHIHALVDRFIPLAVTKLLEKRCGLGRTRWDWVAPQQRGERISYLLRYLCRDMRRRRKNPALKHVRLLTASGSASDAGRWWRRYSDLVVVDTGNEFRKALQIRLEAVHGDTLALRTRYKPSMPIRTVDLLAIATLEDIESAKKAALESAEKLLANH